MLPAALRWADFPSWGSAFFALHCCSMVHSSSGTNTVRAVIVRGAWWRGGVVREVVVLNIVFVLLAAGVIYGALVVPLYNFATRPVKAGRDIVIVVFSVIFTVVFLQILWSIHSDLHHWLG